MISENKRIHISTSAEDELSTSAGSSDNEVISGDESPKHPVSGYSLAPPPGLGQRSLAPPPGFGKRAVVPPPGLSLAAPPGLSLGQQIRPPPGLEGFSRPPGVFLAEAQPPAATARGTRTKRSKQASSAKVCKQPVETDAAPGIRKPAPAAATAPPANVPMRSPVLREFDQATYRKELSDLLRELANGTNGTNVAACVQRVRIQNVPKERQAAEFADILTRAAEESRGIARRLSFAFAAGLAAGGPGSAFDVEECARGLEFFFLEVFEDLAAEVPRLRNKLANELAPTLRVVFSEEQLARLIPPECRPMLR